MQSQDSTDPTGVSGPSGGRRENGGTGGGTANGLYLARHRKAAAALQMRLAGANWTEICKGVGYPTPRTAQVAVERALIRELHESNDRDKMRRLAGARLDRLLRSAWTKAISPDHPEHLAALSKAREVVADHRKLFGLDAPTEVIVHNPTQAELEAWVATVVSTAVPQVVEYDIFNPDDEASDEEVTDTGQEPRALPPGPTGLP
jgi:hypothetical protein